MKKFIQPVKIDFLDDYSHELVEMLCHGIEHIQINYVKMPGDTTGYHIDPYCLHITYTKSGLGKSIVGEKNYVLKPGFINIVYPYEPHSFTSDADNPFLNYVLKIFFKGTIPYGLPRMFNVGRRRQNFEKIFSRLHDIHHAPQNAISKLHEMVELMSLFVLLLESAGGRKNSEFPKNLNDAFCKSIIEIQQPPFTFPGIDSLADRCHMSRKKYTTLFRSATGHSPCEFWNITRMSYVKDMLKKRRYSIKEIAIDCGFSNSQNFIRAFKKYFNCSPTVYRKKLIKQG